MPPALLAKIRTELHVLHKKEPPSSTTVREALSENYIYHGIEIEAYI